jgi:hypothetical protein
MGMDGSHDLTGKHWLMSSMAIPAARKKTGFVVVEYSSTGM